MTHDESQEGEGAKDGTDALNPDHAPEPIANPKPREYTDGRKPFDWTSHYPKEAQKVMDAEASTLILMLAIALGGVGLSLCLVDQQSEIVAGSLKIVVSFRLFAIFFAGCVGGITFSIKWLIHAVARGKWHLDRKYWRFMVPITGGVYACVVMTLFASGLLAGQGAQASGVSGTIALAFLVGYFSDGVSGLLSNIANAVFGTLEKK